MQAKLSTQGKIAVMVDQSWAPKTAKLTRGVAHTSLWRVGHPARVLDWVLKRKKNTFCIFPFLLSYYPLHGPHAAKSEIAVTYIQIILYYSTLVQTNVSLLQSLRDECVWYVRGLSWNLVVLLEIFAVAIILSPISSVCGIFRVGDKCILQCVQYATHLFLQHTVFIAVCAEYKTLWSFELVVSVYCSVLQYATHCVFFLVFVW